MFDSLKGKFKNLFKKEHVEEEHADGKAPEAEPPKKIERPAEKPAEKPVKERPKEKKPVYDDDDLDDFEFGDDLIADDGSFDDDIDDEENNKPVKAPKAEPKKIERPAEKPLERPAERPPVQAEPVKKAEPVQPRPAVKAEDRPVERPAEKPAERPVARTEPEKRTEPAPVPARPAEPAPVSVPKPQEELSKKERIKLAKQEKKLAAKQEKIAAKEEKIAAKEEKIAAREAEKHEKLEKKHDSGELVGDHGKKIKDRNLDDLLWELEVALMEADVALPVVEEIMKGVKDDLSGKRYSKEYSLGEIVGLSVKDSISKILKINEFDFDAWLSTRQKPAVVMFVGINGTGKTTAIAKIANRLIKDGKSVVLAASDTFRAGAIEQLTIHSERLGCKIVKHSADADPAAVAYDAIEHAKAKRKDVVLVDTAGRMQTNSNLMDEMKKIKKVAKPDLIMFVGDSLAGNDAVEQARAFDAAISVDAIMLTKIDADSKGGAALSIAHTIGKPIAFVSNGQEYDQLVKFSSKWMMERLFED